MRCLAAVLSRSPQIPEGMQLNSVELAIQERLFNLVLQYNQQAMGPIDLTQGFRWDAVRMVLQNESAKRFHKILGGFGQRYRLSPERLLALASLITTAQHAFTEVREWLLVSDGVGLHIVMTGSQAEQKKSSFDELIRLATTTGNLGLAIHDNASGDLQLGFSLSLGSETAAGLSFLFHASSPALPLVSLPTAG